MREMFRIIRRPRAGEAGGGTVDILVRPRYGDFGQGKIYQSNIFEVRAVQS